MKIYLEGDRVRVRSDPNVYTGHYEVPGCLGRITRVDPITYTKPNVVIYLVRIDCPLHNRGWGAGKWCTSRELTLV